MEHTLDIMEDILDEMELETKLSSKENGIWGTVTQV